MRRPAAFLGAAVLSALAARTSPAAQSRQTVPVTVQPAVAVDVVLFSRASPGTVVTTTGTTSVQTLRKHERANNVEFKELFGKDHADSFLLLESGRADAFVMDGQILAGNISKAKNPADFKIVGEVLSVEPIACMMRKDDPAFKKAVDDSIKNMIKNGDLAKLYDKWFMQPIPPSNTKVGLPASDATKAAWANPNDKPAEEYAEK